MNAKMLLCTRAHCPVLDTRQTCTVATAGKQFAAHRHLHRDNRGDVDNLPWPRSRLTNAQAN